MYAYIYIYIHASSTCVGKYVCKWVRPNILIYFFGYEVLSTYPYRTRIAIDVYIYIHIYIYNLIYSFVSLLIY